ncbi:MAG: YkgJ family cysteine cluster protein [Deltaproteobacteria bacterium]|nr:YkgJ family cysteine cluster protein [Deltaproteobacteria bacterium]
MFSKKVVTRDSIFLTMEQALEAVCIDFRQYAPQTLLFCAIIRLISGGETQVKRDMRKNGVWISMPGRPNMRWMDESELVDYVCEIFTGADLNPELLSSVCARVFQTRAFPAVHPETGQAGIRIETGMEDFNCRQCGQCCRSLDYRKEVRAEDVTLWRELGRTDILKWVGVIKRGGRETAYRIWVTPGTGAVAEGCPFLKREASKNRWYCGIHDVKPEICRQYPASRKHAIMTGCPGFSKQSKL